MRRLIRDLSCWMALLIVVVPALPHSLQPLPQYESVVDQTDTLTAEQRNELALRLRAFAELSKTRLALIVLHSTRPEPIDAYANRLVHDWRLWNPDTGRGAAMIVAIQDRETRIEVSRALEGDVPDLAVNRILRGVVSPALQDNDVYRALSDGSQALMTLISGTSIATAHAVLPAQTALGSVRRSAYEVHQPDVVAVPWWVALLTVILGFAAFVHRLLAPASVAGNSTADESSTDAVSSGPPHIDNGSARGVGSYAGGGASDRW